MAKLMQLIEKQEMLKALEACANLGCVRMAPFTATVVEPINDYCECGVSDDASPSYHVDRCPLGMKGETYWFIPSRSVPRSGAEHGPFFRAQDRAAVWGARRPCDEYDDGRELCATCQARVTLNKWRENNQ